MSFQINEYLDTVANDCSRCEVFSIGQSYEGRDMKVIKVIGPIEQGTLPNLLTARLRSNTGLGGSRDCQLPISI